MERFDYSLTLPDGSTVFDCAHEIWNTIKVTFPPDYFTNEQGETEVPRYVKVGISIPSDKD